MMKVWNVWLVFIRFLLFMLGTLLSSTGGVRSVHAFAQSSIGSWFVAFLSLIILVGFREIYSWICLILCVFVASTVGLEFYRGAKVIRARSGASFVTSAIELTMRNTRRYGGYIVHMGMVFVFIGLAGAAFKRDLQKDMRQGDSMQIGPYTLVLQGFDTKPEKNYTAQRLLVEVLRNKKPIMMLYPEKRRFETTTENGKIG